MPTEEMVEKVARAICAASGLDPDAIVAVEVALGKEPVITLRWQAHVPQAEAALAAMGEREAVPVAWRYRWVERTGDDELPGPWRYTLTEVKFEGGRDGSWREVQPLYASPRPEAATYCLMRRAVLQEDEGNEHIIGTYPTAEAAEAAIEAESGGGYFKRGDFYVAAVTKEKRTVIVECVAPLSKPIGGET